MKFRYFRDERGALKTKARVFDPSEHGIDGSMVDREAISIIERLVARGHSAFIVGGAVRDLLLGKRPKDFDIVTDALPNRIRKLFSNSRIIGRRFKLVHIYAGERIYEVSTFRSLSTGTVGNEYGTIDEDVCRRDFTVNSLYYDPLTGELVDFLGGIEDLRKKRLKAIIPLERIFREDPVRLVRGVKYAVANGFSIPLALRYAIRRDAPLLTQVSSSRLTEEFYKILVSGKSVAILKALEQYRLLPHFMPEVAASIKRSREFGVAFIADLASLDMAAQLPRDSSMLNKVSAAEIVQTDRRLISPFITWFIRERLKSFARNQNAPKDPQGFRQAAYTDVREFLTPLNLPRVALEEAIESVLHDEDLMPAPPPPKRRKRGPRRKKAAIRLESNVAADTTTQELSQTPKERRSTYGVDAGETGSSEHA